MLTARAAVPQGGQLAFRAERNGSAIGSHSLRFVRQGDTLNVDIAVDYLVKFGPIPLFRYKLRAREIWRGDVLVEITSETNNDGDADFLRATRQGDALAVEGSKSGRYVAPAGAIAATHWNRRQLDAPMINPQTGVLMRYAVTPGALEPIAFADGSTRTARRYGLAGIDPLELWYDEAGEWSALRALAKDGSEIRYIRG
jgi:hypothetical protein